MDHDAQEIFSLFLSAAAILLLLCVARWLIRRFLADANGTSNAPVPAQPPQAAEQSKGGDLSRAKAR